MKVLPHVVGMLVLGLVSLAVFAGVQQWRVHKQTATASIQQSSATGATRPPAPLYRLSNGIEASLRRASGELQRNRSEGASALDAAKRATEAGGEPFRTVHGFLMQARLALQNDDSAAARRLIEQALGKLPDVRSMQKQDRQASLQGFVGSTLIDARGERIGEVAGMERREGRWMVELSLGGVHNAGGFIDIGSRSKWVPAEELVFGKRKLIGATLVAWPAASR